MCFADDLTPVFGDVANEILFSTFEPFDSLNNEAVLGATVDTS